MAVSRRFRRPARASRSPLHSPTPPGIASRPARGSLCRFAWLAVLPHNWQVVIAVLGTYGVIATIATSGAPPAPPAPEKPDLKTGEIGRCSLLLRSACECVSELRGSRAVAFGVDGRPSQLAPLSLLLSLGVCLVFAEAVISEVPTLSENPEAWATFMEEEENVVKYFDSLNEE